MAVYADLVKARLTLLVLLTTLVGFYIGFQGPMDYFLMFHTLFGTALVAGGADVNAVNDAGETALHVAVSRGDGLVRALVENGEA